MHSNTQLSVDITSYYAKQLFLKPITEIEEDFFIENAKAEISIRIGQSKFRNGVLKNFDFKCALTDIVETSLLNASHIVPWSHKKEFRGDISNGICLYVEYDALFDKGYLTFSNDLEVAITTYTSKLSQQLVEKLNSIKGKRMRKPKNKRINMDYVEYHRNYIFQG